MATSIPGRHPYPRFDPSITIDGSTTLTTLKGAYDDAVLLEGRVVTVEGLVDGNDVAAIDGRVTSLEGRVDILEGA